MWCNSCVLLMAAQGLSCQCKLTEECPVDHQGLEGHVHQAQIHPQLVGLQEQ